MDLIQRLRDLFARHFPGGQLVAEAPRAGGRIAAYLIWDGFDALEQSDRQRRVWAVARAELSPEDQMRLMAILTVTADELEVMQGA